MAKQYYEEARRNYESKITKGVDSGTLHSRLAIAYAGLGDKEKAIREAEKAMEIFPVTLDAFYHPQIKALAHMYMLLEDYENAIKQLEFLLTEGDQWSVPFVKNDPTWEPLHDHPRFKKLTQSAIHVAVFE